MLQKLWKRKIVRFACVGVFNTLFDITILNSLVFFLRFPILIANLISASISISVSYFLNHHIVFRSKEEHTYLRFLHFFLVTGIGILAVQSFVIGIVTHLLGTRDIGINHVLGIFGIAHLSTKFLNLNIAKILAVLVAMTWNFSLYHFIVFKDKDDEIVVVG